MARSNLLLILFLNVICAVEFVAGDICFKPVCEFTFVVRHSRSMMYTATNSNGTKVTYKVGLHSNGSLYLQPTTFIRDVPSDIVVPTDQVHTLDGHTRTFITINDQFPGPTIEVMEGTEVVVNVVNELTKESLTIHWHGMHMKHNPWMDGVAYVTQCPIQPKESFRYRFIADPAGTHWYHSHFEGQRADGMFGAIIVHRSQPRLSYDVMMVNDWYPVTSSEFDLDSPYHLPTGGPGELFDNPSIRNHIFDGTETSPLRYWSSLINGRGRHGDNKAPLHVFTVKSGTKNRIHLIMAGLECNYRLSIDQHNLTVIETDGHLVQPLTVDSVLGFQGETFVIEFTADQPVGRYWIRATWVRTGTSLFPKPDGKTLEALAILHYTGSDETTEPRTQPRACTEERSCRVLNCPWVVYHRVWYPHRECIPITQLKADSPDPLPSEKQSPKENVFEIFLNFGFPIGSSINFHRNVLPRAPLFQKPSTWGLTPCSRECTEKGCLCTYVISIPANRTVQLVLTSYPVRTNEASLPASNMHHSVHLHGHSFQVLKIGFPTANQTTGRPIKQNDDVICENLSCSRPRWKAGQATGLNTDSPPVKNVVNVPAYGYTVIRFRSDNPGYWFLHCHQLLHNVEGMSLILNESNSGLPPAPPGLPTCYDYKMGRDEFQAMMVKNKQCVNRQCQTRDADTTGRGNDQCPDVQISWVHLVLTGCLCTLVGVLANNALFWCWLGGRGACTRRTITWHTQPDALN